MILGLRTIVAFLPISTHNQEMKLARSDPSLIIIFWRKNSLQFFMKGVWLQKHHDYVAARCLARRTRTFFNKGGSWPFSLGNRGSKPPLEITNGQGSEPDDVCNKKQFLVPMGGIGEWKRGQVHGWMSHFTTRISFVFLCEPLTAAATEKPRNSQSLIILITLAPFDGICT